MYSKILTFICCLFFASGTLCAKTRAEVASGASSMVTITPAWTASLNTHQFGDYNFTSHFSTGMPYSLWPYVYGGKENSSVTVSRITAGTSPGGRNVTTIRLQ